MLPRQEALHRSGDASALFEPAACQRANRGNSGRLDRGHIRSTVAPVLSVVLPFSVYILHARTFGSWIIDDAGISFAYARNLAMGFGLVAQPGVPPVEGFSNFSWVMLMTLFHLLRVFDPVLTPKLVSCLLVLVSFAILGKWFASATDRPILATFVVLSLLAINTSFVVWTISGLENPLYVFLLCAYLALTTTLMKNDFEDGRAAFASGLVAGLIAMTRPDGVIYMLAVPLLSCAAILPAPRSRWKRTLSRLLLFGLAAAVTYGSFLAFRLSYFGDLVPNTAHAKGSPSLQSLRSLLLLDPQMLGQASQLVKGVLGSVGPLIAALMIFLTAYHLGTRRLRKEYFPLGLLLAFSTAAFLLLPGDWMPEYRFATPFFVFWYAFAFVVAATTLASFSFNTSLRAGIAVLLIVLVFGASVREFRARSLSFAAAPTVPFEFISEQYARRFSRYGEMLGVTEGSILIPDLGGMLYYSEFRVYDLAGLCDRVIAKTRVRQPAAFYDYVFDQIKPTFIHTHGQWTISTHLEDDVRFRRDYVPLYEFPEPRSVANAKNGVGRVEHSGDFVRRDAVIGKEAALDKVRELDAKESPEQPR